METEHEHIFPFNPLYVSSIPIAPMQIIDEEMIAIAEKMKCKFFQLDLYIAISNNNTIFDAHVFNIDLQPLLLFFKMIQSPLINQIYIRNIKHVKFSYK